MQDEDVHGCLFVRARGDCAPCTSREINFEAVSKGEGKSPSFNRMAFLLDALMRWLNGATRTSHMVPADPPARQVFEDLERRRTGRPNPKDLQIWVPPNAAFIGGWAPSAGLLPSPQTLGSTPGLVRPFPRRLAEQATDLEAGRSRVIHPAPTPNEGW